MTVSLVAAVARGGVIGRKGEIPWRLPEDIAHFKNLTTGHAVVMGRRTWDSLPERFRPLPGRRNVVVTRNPEWRADGAERAGSLEQALTLLSDEPRVFVIGGAEIYAAGLPHADEFVLTEIDLDVEGDTFFPEWDPAEFEEVSREARVAADATPFAFVTYRAVADLQLSALADVASRLDSSELEYWLFGGWAVDFYAGRTTRPHFDVDIAVWLDDLPQIDRVLRGFGWRHAPEPEEDGGTGYERDRVRLELTYLVRREDGRVVTPLRETEATWPEDAFGTDARELRGVRARLVGFDALARGKSSARDDPDDAAKDRADFDALSALGRDS